SRSPHRQMGRASRCRSCSSGTPPSRWARPIPAGTTSMCSSTAMPTTTRWLAAPSSRSRTSAPASTRSRSPCSTRTIPRSVRRRPSRSPWAAAAAARAWGALAALATETDRSGSASQRRTVERYSRKARWFHAAIYLTVLVLLGTGWWLLFGQEGNPSPLSRLTGRPDTQLHTWVGWVMTAIVVLGLVGGMHAVATFAAESIHFRRSDLGWFLSWPKALLTGRFARHEGHFDPGQRIANILLVAILVMLVVSGVGLALLHGGPAFAVLVHVHRW